ncbi:NADPH:quinone reductase-like Zn-dependent oxidoreductase [Microbacterium resistens]|uniref:NADPH:quinone reductase-like Zn-dependent oxidoreductase n=1 Tax=Microbacterium resistens TaxID=156977 RepID=A0ABU1SFD2_9MICO|nr:NADP-dependent oxidoreductase [Microbacterium resistens]MDR6868304.1 NADPH:quinone reductase-like Zn-dependent oxidoreductase [Microbacterium resistens]
MGLQAQRWVATAWGEPSTWEFVDTDVPEPGPGEATIRVRAAGVNPADAKHVAVPRADRTLPVPIGYEVSGELVAIGPGTRIGSGPASIGDEVLAFRVQGGYATALTVPAEKVFRKPATLAHAEAANLLLAGSTAAEMLEVTGVAAGETILLHGASGAVGASVLQQAALRGARVIGTASERGADRARRFGGLPVRYGPGLAARVRDLLAEAAGPDVRIAAALDAVGTDEAVETSLELVPDRGRIVTIANAARAAEDGFLALAGTRPGSAAFRDAVRPRLIELAERGELVVPVSQTLPLEDAQEAHRVLAQGRAGGKLALVP